MKKLDLQLGDIIWTNFRGKDHIQNGIRPSVVVQNNRGNHFSTTVQVVPLTSRLDKTKLPTHTIIPNNQTTGLKKKSVAQCEGSRLISKSDVLGQIGRMDFHSMKEVAKCWLINNPLLIFFTAEELGELREKLIEDNKTYN